MVQSRKEAGDRQNINYKEAGKVNNKTNNDCLNNAMLPVILHGVHVLFC